MSCACPICSLQKRMSEVAKKSVSARPRPILGETLGARMGPGRAGMAPTSGPGWVRNTVKQITWRIWTGPLGTRDGTWTCPGSDPGEGLDGTPRDSNRLLGLSENAKETLGEFLCLSATNRLRKKMPRVSCVIASARMVTSRGHFLRVFVSFSLLPTHLRARQLSSPTGGLR